MSDENALEEIAALRSKLSEAERELAEARKDGERSGIYFASKVKHAADWRALRAAGYHVTSSWIDEAGEGETADHAELSSRCLQEIRRSAALVLCCQPGEILKGALLEVGAALAFGVPVLCVAPADSPSISRVFRKHPLWRDFDDLRAALDAARQEGPNA